MKFRNLRKYMQPDITNRVMVPFVAADLSCIERLYETMQDYLARLYGDLDAISQTLFLPLVHNNN